MELGLTLRWNRALTALGSVLVLSAWVDKYGTGSGSDRETE
jgi:hypothetical protein